MRNKMSVEEFCAKLDSEGVAYAFLDYGLSHEDLDPDEDPDFYKLVKRINDKFDDLYDDLRELDKYTAKNVK